MKRPTIIIELPYPPSVNAYYGHRSSGKHRVIKYVKADGKQFQQDVEVLIRELGISSIFPLSGRLAVKVLLTEPAPKRKRDIDNPMKALLDAITLAKVWVDDSQIDDLHIKRQQHDSKHPRGKCTVQIDLI